MIKTRSLARVRVAGSHSANRDPRVFARLDVRRGAEGARLQRVRTGRQTREANVSAGNGGQRNTERGKRGRYRNTARGKQLDIRASCTRDDERSGRGTHSYRRRG